MNRLARLTLLAYPGSSGTPSAATTSNPLATCTPTAAGAGFRSSAV